MLQGMLLRKKNANDQPDPKHELTLEFRKILALFIIGNKTIAILFSPSFSVCLNEKSHSDYKAEERCKF